MAKKPSTVIGALDDKLQRTIDEHQELLRKSIGTLEKRIVERMQKLKTTKDGLLVGPKVNLKQAQKIHAELGQLVQQTFGEEVKSYMKEFPGVARAISQSWKGLDVAAKFTGIDKDMIDALRTSTYQEFVQFGQAAQAKIARTMYDYVASQGSFGDLMAQVQGVLTGHQDVKGRPMTNYVDTYAVDAVMNFERTVSAGKAEQAGLTHFMYVGSIIKDSRDFCRQRAGGIFTKETIDSWNALDWQGKSGDVWTDLGGWRCRHSLQPVEPSWFPDIVVDALKPLK